MKRLTFACAFLALAVATANAPAFAAHPSPGKIYVDDDCDPATDDGTTRNPFCSIQEAENHAQTGDTIFVRQGRYIETTTVDVSVKILGAKWDVSARSGRVDESRESVVDSPNGGFNIATDGVMIAGFTIRDSTNAALGGAGILITSTTSGHRIKNNVITNNVIGMYLGSSGGTPTVVSGNRFVANNQPGAASGNGIYGDQGVKDVHISQNLFTGNDNASMVLTGVATGDNSGLTIKSNAFDNTIVLSHTDGATVNGNGSRETRGSAIFVGGSSENILINGNSVLRGASNGVRITADFGSINDNITVKNNRFKAMGSRGISLASSALTGGTFTGNIVRDTVNEGILVSAGNTGNTFEGNSAFGAANGVDISDSSTGTGTLGTANTWVDNACDTSVPDGLCTAS